ncbi:MAG: nucleotide exchange factor GrpE, partial [Nitrospirae bacterium]
MEEKKQPTDDKDSELALKEEGAVEEKQEEEVVAVEKTPEQEIEELKKELEQYKDKYLRLYAEFENYKKRVQK